MEKIENKLVVAELVLYERKYSSTFYVRYGFQPSPNLKYELQWKNFPHFKWWVFQVIKSYDTHAILSVPYEKLQILNNQEYCNIDGWNSKVGIEWKYLTPFTGNLCTKCSHSCNQMCSFGLIKLS